MKRTLLVLPLLLLWGCDDGDRAAVQKESSIAAEHAGKAASLAWNSLSKELSKVDLGSSKQALIDAQKKAEQGVTDLKKQGHDAGSQVSELQKQVDRLKAAIDIKDLQAKMDDLTKQAKQANETLDAARQRLKGGNDAFQQLQGRVSKAQEEYNKLTDQTPAK